MMRAKIFAGSYYSTWTTAVQHVFTFNLFFVVTPSGGLRSQKILILFGRWRTYSRSITGRSFCITTLLVLRTVLCMRLSSPLVVLNPFRKVNYKEETTLTKMFQAAVPSVKNSETFPGDTLGQVEGVKSSFTWTYAPLPADCVAVTYSIMEGENFEFALHLAETCKEVHVINPSVPYSIPFLQSVPYCSADRFPKNSKLILHQHKIDLFSYESTLTVKDFMEKNSIPTVRWFYFLCSDVKIHLLVLNVGVERRQGRSMRILKGYAFGSSCLGLFYQVASEIRFSRESDSYYRERTCILFISLTRTIGQRVWLLGLQLAHSYCSYIRASLWIDVITGIQQTHVLSVSDSDSEFTVMKILTFDFKL